MPTLSERTAQNSIFNRLRPLLTCQKTCECDQQCCQEACRILQNDYVPNVKLVATQILAVHNFQFSSNDLADRNLLLAFLQIEQLKKILSFLETVDVELLTQFNIMELDLIMNRLKKSFSKNPDLSLSRQCFLKLWSCLFYIEVDTWKNWRVIFMTLLDLKRDSAITGPDYKMKLFSLIHPLLPWTLKIKYQALAVLLNKIPIDCLVKTFPEISAQLLAALDAQEISTVTGDLVLAYCIRFVGFWEETHEFHQLFVFLVNSVFDSRQTIRARVKTLWLPKLLACFELKGFFEKLKSVCSQNQLSKCIREPEHVTWTNEEQRVYGMLLMNRLTDNAFTDELKAVCEEWALFAANQEICLLALIFLRRHKEHFSIQVIARAILINFDSANQDIGAELLAIFKTTEFADDLYSTMFKWMNPELKLFYSRQSFLLAAFSHFSAAFFKKKEKVFDFLALTGSYNVNEVAKLLTSLVPTYGDDLRDFWKNNLRNLGKNPVECLILFQQYCSQSGIDYCSSELPEDLQCWQSTPDVVRLLVAENESILNKFGSGGLGTAIPVTAVVGVFTAQDEQEHGVSLIKLNQHAVQREKAEFVEPLIFNCTRLTMSLKGDLGSAEMATNNITQVILRVKNKKIIDRVSDLFLEYLVRLNKDFAGAEFDSIWMGLYGMTMSFYEDCKLDCRSLAAWRVLLALLEVCPDKFDGTMTRLLNLWIQSEEDCLIVRAGKAIKALVSTSKFDSSKYFVCILTHSFEAAARGSFPVSSNMGHLIATICTRIFPQEPTLVMLSVFCTKYPGLFDCLCDLFVRGAAGSFKEDANARGLCQIVGFFQKMFAVQSIDYSGQKTVQRQMVLEAMKRLSDSPNVYLRNAVLQSLSQLGIDEFDSRMATAKADSDLKRFKQRLRSCKSHKDAFAVEIDASFDSEGKIKLKTEREQLKFICRAALSNSIFDRKQGASFVLSKSTNLDPQVALIGLLVFANDEVDEVGQCFRLAGHVVKPWVVLMDHIEKNNISADHLRLAMDLMRDLTDAANKNNEALDGTVYDRIMMLKTCC